MVRAYLFRTALLFPVSSEEVLPTHGVIYLGGGSPPLRKQEVAFFTLTLLLINDTRDTKCFGHDIVLMWK